MNKAHLIKVLDKGFRYDKRKLDEIRKIEIKYGASQNAEGSALVKIGDTEVIVGVKMALEKPYSDTPEKGNLSVNVELIPLSNPKFEPGPPSIQAIELARVVDRGVRESGAIDLKKLCITPGEKVWTLFIDVVAINDAGNLRDAASVAVLAAIKDARFPIVEDDQVNYKKKSDKKVPLNDEPIEVTILKIGNHLIVDPTLEEELFTEARLTVASLNDGTICALQKGEDIPLSIDEVEKMIELAINKAKEYRKMLK